MMAKLMLTNLVLSAKISNKMAEKKLYPSTMLRQQFFIYFFFLSFLVFFPM